MAGKRGVMWRMTWGLRHRGEGGKRFPGAPPLGLSGFVKGDSAIAQEVTRGGRYGGNTAHLPDANLRAVQRWDSPSAVDLWGG